MRGGWREWVLTTKNQDDVYYDDDFSLLELSEGSSIFLSHRIWKGGAIKFSPSKIVNFKWNSHYFFCGKKKNIFVLAGTGILEFLLRRVQAARSGPFG